MLFASPDLDAADEWVLDLIEDQHRRLRLLLAGPRRWWGLLRRMALALSVRGSNLIEGFTVSVDDAFAIVDDLEPAEASELAWRAVRGYRDAMTYTLQLAEEPLDLSVPTLRALHFMTQQYDLSKWPGRYRPGDVYVYDGRNQMTVYVGPNAREVPDLVDELVEDVIGAESTPLLVRASMAHLNFVMIHPFKDGNGRMARCLQTLVLACDERFAAPEFVSIEEYLGDNTQEYYRVLAQVGGGVWDPRGDTRPWIRFCLTAHYRQALVIERRAEVASRLWVRAEEEAERAGLPERCVQPLTYSMLGRVLRNVTYRQLTDGVTQNLAGRDLTELVRADLLDARGEKRGRYYVPSTRMSAVAREISESVGLKLSLDANPYEMAPT
ncbi:Fic family protein [Kibdelosporangium lantanae]|uniref:Fic family protein n=1 Tax=Kibdelosporangium lantanae TaxID=1497396 RepID=A0ABW3MES1_9PSEU